VPVLYVIMKKRYVLLFVALLCLAIPCVALAHPGRTDEDGGHTDHSTGEYHYHHGYPAHDHYDMDGDGDLDCPYNFVDRTGYNSGSSSSSSGSSSTRVVTQTETVYVDKWYIPDWWFYSSCAILILCLVFFVMFLNKRKTLLYEEKENASLREQLSKESENHRLVLEKLKDQFVGEIEKHRKAITEMEAKHKDELKETKFDLLWKMETYLVDAFGEDWLYILSKAPSGAEINKYGLPQIRDGSNTKWGKDYTFYAGASDPAKRLSTKYHVITCRYANPYAPVNAYEVKHRHIGSCAHCSSKLPDLEWVDKYMEIKSFFCDIN